jgi:hypothetical protein
MYNDKIKSLFFNSLKGYAEGTIRNYKFILNKASETEKMLDKDIYNFTLEECDKLLKSYSNKSLNMVCVNKSCLESYIDFCIYQGHISPFQPNFFKSLSRRDLNRYVDFNTINNKYISYDELRELEEQCVNGQDAVGVRLLFIGVKGEECVELLNLRVKNIREDRIILPHREVMIDENSYSLIQEAINQKVYEKGNGEVNITSKSSHMVINQSEYVLRPSGSSKQGELNYNTFRVRINRVREYFGNPYINIRNIWFSGIIHMLKQIKNKNGVLTNQDYINIHKIYGYNEAYIYKTIEEVEKYL